MSGFDEALAAVADLPDPVRLVDRDGRTLACNDAARAERPNGLGHRCDGSGRRNPSCPACQIGEVFDRGQLLRWHVLVDDGRGKSDAYEVTLSPVRDAGGEVVAVLEMLRDATAVLSLENYLISRAERQDEQLSERAVEARALAERAQELGAELGTLRETQTEVLYRDRLMALSLLVSGLAHEIHTPLGALLSSTDLIRRIAQKARTELGEPAELRLAALDSQAVVAADAAERIRSIVRTLRLFSNVDEAPVQEFDLHEGLDSTLKLLHYRMGDRIRLVREYGDIPRLFCRPEACNQVFMNVLLNSVQAIEDRGEIRVRTRADEERVVVEIADDGVGIPAEAIERIFDLGFTTRGGRGGSGIGLALARRIVHGHGGSIDVQSGVGAGTTFRLILPLRPAAGAIP